MLEHDIDNGEVELLRVALSAISQFDSNQLHSHPRLEPPPPAEKFWSMLKAFDRNFRQPNDEFLICATSVEFVDGRGLGLDVPLYFADGEDDFDCVYIVFELIRRHEPSTLHVHTVQY